MAVKTFVFFASLVGGFLAYVLLRLSYLLFFCLFLLFSSVSLLVSIFFVFVFFFVLKPKQVLCLRICVPDR